MSYMDTESLSDVKHAKTPLKCDDSVQNASKSQTGDRNVVNTYKTPVRCNESLWKKGKLPSRKVNRSNVIKKMPIYSPPTSINDFVKNPFEDARLLKERLSQPMCSPSLFEKMVSPVVDDQFNWSIEDISNLRPAPINENPSQDFDSWFSPATESEAQKAINKFFSSQMVNMESPMVSKQNNTKDVTKETSVATTWSQTMLSFPPVLPLEIEKILSTYCTFSDDQVNQDNEDLNISNCSNSRKKLSFDSVESDKDLQSHSPLQNNNKCIKKTIASTPIRHVVPSPELSPILLGKVQDSPMDISITYRSKTRLSLLQDVTMNEKENVDMMSWNLQEKIMAVSSEQTYDSAFSSV